MATPNPSENTLEKPRRFAAIGKVELLGILILASLVAYFLSISWRKWPDPLVDSGNQWYVTWRLTQGAHLYQEFLWTYGPLSVNANAALFRMFGPGMMVLVTANLIIYGAIVVLAYVAFRRAWGALAAFVASAVFISVFSFSRLVDVANYNYATPYAHESTHGMLLALITLFIAARWSMRASRRDAFLLGLCGGLAAVMKPEFMLAGGALGGMAMVLRFVQRQRVSMVELGLVVVGVVLPTLLFALSYLRFESASAAFMHACKAWGIIFFQHDSPAIGAQGFFSGFDKPTDNLLAQGRAISGMAMAIGAIGVAGWFVNRSWSVALRAIAAGAALLLACAARLEKGWIDVGRCFPILIAAIFAVVVFRLRKELKSAGRVEGRTVMALSLVVLAAVMLVRMALYPRVYHFGFYQAALAGMVIAAALVTELPALMGVGLWGRRITIAGAVVLLAVGSFSIANQSRRNQVSQTQAIGSGVDQFYAFNDEATIEMNWALDCIRPIPQDATVLMLPAGVMVNYLSRHRSPMPDLLPDESAYVKKLAEKPPDYVVLLSDLPEFGVRAFGAEGRPGYLIYEWLRANYSIAVQGKKTFFLRKNNPAQETAK